MTQTYAKSTVMALFDLDTHFQIKQAKWHSGSAKNLALRECQESGTPGVQETRPFGNARDLAAAIAVGVKNHKHKMEGRFCSER